MEKNGNTFTPGSKVTLSSGNTKTAAQRGTGRVQGGITDDGRMKVAWQDGTETFEKPEDLNQG